LLEAKVDFHDVECSSVRLSHEKVIEEQFEELRSLSGVGTAFESELQQGQEDKGRHQLVEEGPWRVHQVALLGDGGEHVEKLFSHEVALVVGVQSIHAVLDNVGPELLVLVFGHAFDVWHCAEARQQICYALRQVQVVEQALDEVFLRDYVVEKFLGPLDQPERENLVEVTAESWVQVADLLLHVWIRLLVE
jgi:hypothetical protein